MLRSINHHYKHDFLIEREKSIRLVIYRYRNMIYYTIIANGLINLLFVLSLLSLTLLGSLTSVLSSNSTWSGTTEWRGWSEVDVLLRV